MNWWGGYVYVVRLLAWVGGVEWVGLIVLGFCCWVHEGFGLGCVSLGIRVKLFSCGLLRWLVLWLGLSYAGLLLCVLVCCLGFVFYGLVL